VGSEFNSIQFTKEETVMSGSIWVPPGLLQSVTNKVYNDTRRWSAEEPTERERVEEIISQPAEAVLTQSRTTPFLSAEDQIQHSTTILLAARSNTASQGFEGLTHFQPPKTSKSGQSQQKRSRSVDYSNLHRGHYEGVVDPPSNAFAKKQRERATSITIANLQRRHFNFEAYKATAIGSRSVSPTTFEQNIFMPSKWEGRKSPSTPSPLGRINPLQGDHRTDDGRTSPTARFSPVHSPESRISPTAHLDDVEKATSPAFHSGATLFPPTARRDTTKSLEGASVFRKASIVLADAVKKVFPVDRRSSIRNTYERATSRQKQLQRSKLFMFAFQYTIYLLVLAFIYLVLVGRPLWGGTVWYTYVLFQHKLAFPAGSAIFMGLAAL
jgi:hypothetical protein